MNIVLAGIIGRYPYGGVGWCSLMYLRGLRDLGHTVTYVEDTGECNIDPVANTVAGEPSYALAIIRKTLEPHGFGDRWCYIDYSGSYHGMDENAWRAACRDADLFLNLSGGCWYWRPEYEAIPHSAFIDTDPAFTQLSLAKGEPWYVDFFSKYRVLFTFGRNIGTEISDVPTGPFDWHHTWQPVSMDQWTPTDGVDTNSLTTVMTWQIESFGDIGGNKNIEFEKIIDLPKYTDMPIELAVSCPDSSRAIEDLAGRGWRCRLAFQVSHSIDAYRNYIRGSLGEFSVAKHTYVRTRSGWFSDRTECYLAAGRPAVVQDTGFSAHLPTGEGLIPFTDLQTAIAGVEEVRCDYDRHRKAARAIAAEHFDSSKILLHLLETATSSGPAP